MPARIAIRLTPRASRETIVREREGVLHVRVAAPPVNGAANAAMVKLLAKRLRVAKSAVTIVSGDTSRNKVVEVEGLEDADVRARLALDGAGR